MHMYKIAIKGNMDMYVFVYNRYIHKKIWIYYMHKSTGRLSDLFFVVNFAQSLSVEISRFMSLKLFKSISSKV